SVRAPLVLGRPRITLAIDPSCTPREVTAAYRTVRRERFGRLKRLSKKHAQLATFAATHYKLSAAEQLTTWNRKMPQYRYLSVFKRDRDRATERLLRVTPK